MHSQAVDDPPIIVIDDDETMRRACQAALRLLRGGAIW